MQAGARATPDTSARLQTESLLAERLREVSVDTRTSIYDKVITVIGQKKNLIFVVKCVELE